MIQKKAATSKLWGRCAEHLATWGPFGKWLVASGFLLASLPGGSKKPKIGPIYIHGALGLSGLCETFGTVYAGGWKIENDLRY